MFARFTGTQSQRTGDWNSITAYADRAGCVGIVDAPRTGIEIISEAAYLAEKAAIVAHNAAIPPVVVPDPGVPAWAGILAKADGDVTAADVKELALSAFRRLQARGVLR